LASPLAAQSSVEAALAEAKTAVRAQDYAGALAVLARVELAESPEVLLMQASLYQAGRGVARDDVKAYGLTEAAAALGSVDAQYNLGRLLLAGRGVAANREEGQAWIVRAAEGGHIRAAALLVNLLQSPAAPVRVAEPVVVVSQVVQGSEISRRMGWTPLMEAARRGQHMVLEPLLASANLEAQDANGRTALMLALEAADDMAVDMLLRAGADVEAVDKAGNTALAYAALTGAELQVRMLLASGAWPDIPNMAEQTPLDIAVASGHGDVAALMLEKRGLTLPDPLLAQLWFAAAAQGPSRLIEALRARGGACDMRDANGLRALDLAAENGNLAMAQACLQGDTAMPLLRAVRAGHPEVAVLLLAAGADPNAQSESGNSALIMAANAGDQPLVAALLQAGAEIDHRNQAGNSALMLAAKNGWTEVVGALLEAGADTGLRNKRREQAYSIARAAGHLDLAGLLE